MDVKAGYDVDSQKAKDIKSNEQTAWCSTNVLENSELEKMQTQSLLDGIFVCFFPNSRLLVLVVVFVVLRIQAIKDGTPKWEYSRTPRQAITPIELMVNFQAHSFNELDWVKDQAANL